MILILGFFYPNMNVGIWTPRCLYWQIVFTSIYSHYFSL